MYWRVSVAIPLPLTAVLKITCPGASSECTMTVPVIVNVEVRVRFATVESGMSTPGPLKERWLSCPNHHAPAVVPLTVACPIPSKVTPLLGKTVAPGWHGAKEHGDWMPCVFPSATPPCAPKLPLEKLKPTLRHAPREG